MVGGTQTASANGASPMVTLTGDRDRDMAVIESFYSAVSGHHPEKMGPIKLSR